MQKCFYCRKLPCRKSFFGILGMLFSCYLYLGTNKPFAVMKIVRVQYTTTQEFATTNQANIAAIVAELKELQHPGIKYGCWLLPDGKTFMHFDQFENEEAHNVLTELQSFKKFDAQLSSSGLEAAPKLELLSLVASTEVFF
jgi:hypothetical protein